DLLAADVVTADGRLLTVDGQSHPDLFWAIRGGGGNFGVATRFRFRLHELPSIVGGMLILPATPEVIAGFVSQAEAAEDALSPTVGVLPAPPMPFIPAEHHGRLVVLAFMCFAGPAEAAQRALAPFRSLAEPIADMLRPMAYHEIYPPEQPGFHPTAVTHNMFVDGIELGEAKSIVESLETSDAPMRAVQIRVLGGAMARVPADATAFAHRRSRIMVNIAAFYEQPDEAAARQAWADGLAGAIHQSDDGT